MRERIEDARLMAAAARTLMGAAPVGPWAAVGGPSALLRVTARRHPLEPALRTLTETLSYRALDEAVDQSAGFWRRRGIGAGQTVALLMQNCVELVVHALGLMRAGATAGLIGPDRQGPMLHHVLAAMDPIALVVDAPGDAALQTIESPALAGGVLGIGETRWTPIAPALARVESVPVADPVVLDGQPGLLLATSGTTGRPKAARIPRRRAVMAALGFHAFGARLRPGDVVFTPLPLSHASALFAGLFASLWAGACFAFTPRFSVSRYWADASALGATVALYVGELGRYLVDAPPDPMARRHRLRAFMGNGLAADVWPRLVERSGVERVIEFYGATEGNTLLINQRGVVGSCGRSVVPEPFAGLFIARTDVARGELVRDRRGRCVRCADDEPGELLVRIGRTPMNRFDGYRDTRATAAKIVTGVRRSGDRYFRSGDLLRRSRAGDYTFVDRLGDTFRWKGNNVSTQAVAEALAAPGRTLAVYGVRLPGHEGRVGMVALSGPFDPSVFYEQAGALPSHARPAFVRRVERLRHTATAKVRKVELQRQGIDDCGADPLFVRLDAESSYAPLGADHRAAIVAGRLRL